MILKKKKKSLLVSNIKILEELANTINNSIEEIKKIFDKIEENKEQLKEKIQKIFTKIRYILNEREDQLLLEVDNQYNNFYFDKTIIKDNEKLPNKIKKSLEKIKISEKEWNNNDKLNAIINECLKAEKNVQESQQIQKK